MAWREMGSRGGRVSGTRTWIVFALGGTVRSVWIFGSGDRGLIAAPWTPASLLLCSRKEQKGTELFSVLIGSYTVMRKQTVTPNSGWF